MKSTLSWVHSNFPFLGALSYDLPFPMYFVYMVQRSSKMGWCRLWQNSQSPRGNSHSDMLYQYISHRAKPAIVPIQVRSLSIYTFNPGQPSHGNSTAAALLCMHRNHPASMCFSCITYFAAIQLHLKTQVNSSTCMHACIHFLYYCLRNVLSVHSSFRLHALLLDCFALFFL